MTFKKIVIGAAAVLSLAACSKGSDNKAANGAAVNAHALDNTGGPVGSYTAGTPAYTFNVASESLAIDGQAIDRVDNTTFQDPAMAAQVSSLSSTDRVIQTTANSLELWSASHLLVAFDLGNNSMFSTGSNYAITSFSFKMNSAGDKQGQGLSSADLTLTMNDCAVEQPKQDQGQDQGKQGQDQGKQGQDQGKAPAPIDQGKQGQDQGKKSVADVTGAPDQGQGQGKEPGKEEPKGPACRVVTIMWHLEGVEQPKQDQGKQGQDQGKQGQDQGKVPAPVDQGKQGQDQGKVPAPVDQGKQGQDQGKVPAPVDQGKQGQDQGKAPAPIDQGKQGQDQGKAPAPIDQGNQGQDQGKNQGKK